MTPILMNYVFQLKIQELPYHLGLTLLCIVPAIVSYLLVLSTESIIIIIIIIIIIVKRMGKRLNILQE
jgi:hypothetical protein